ncbi:MAG: hypothetical protein H0X22_09785 [Acidimicrobiia bacterium]|nr:hypothetical protein [Acidimicrobiia bacterium]
MNKEIKRRSRVVGIFPTKPPSSDAGHCPEMHSPGDANEVDYTARRSRAPVSLEGWRSLLIARASI